MSSSSSGAAPSRRGRFVLIVLLAVCVGPILVAMVMSRLNLHPSASNSKGELLSPKPDLRAARLARADGGAYAWEPERRLWRIAMSPPPGWCESHAAACAKQAQDLDKVWQLLGKNADRAQVLWFVILPGALPEILTGLRIGLGVGWSTLVAAELIAATRGLGFMVQSAGEFLATDVVLAGIAVIAVIAFGLELGLRALQRRLTPWHGEIQ